MSAIKKKITKPAKPVKQYFFGEVFTNPYLGSKFTEVLNTEKRRAGWVWTHRDGRIVVSPHLGTYVWFGEGGKVWTVETGALWLVHSRRM